MTPETKFIFKDLSGRFGGRLELKATEVAEVLGYTQSTVWNKVSRGPFPIKFRKKNSCLRWRLIDVSRYLSGENVKDSEPHKVNCG